MGMTKSRQMKMTKMTMMMIGMNSRPMMKMTMMIGTIIGTLAKFSSFWGRCLE